MIRFTKRWLYRFGVRPKAGSIWYSPSLAYVYSFHKGFFRK